MNDRHETIVKLLRRHQYMTIQALCEAIDASPATVRRALSRLDERGLLKYVNGGALLLNPDASMNPEMYRQKQRIAQAALSHIKSGDTLFMDSGTTNNMLADMLVDYENIQVVTNSIYIAYRLYSTNEGVKVYVCGGSIEGSSNSIGAMVGEAAEALVQGIRANSFFMGCSALSAAHGITDSFIPAAKLKQCMMRNAQRTILLCDHTKIGQVHMAHVCPVTSVHHMITDIQADPEQISHLKDEGLTIETV